MAGRLLVMRSRRRTHSINASLGYGPDKELRDLGYVTRSALGDNYDGSARAQEFGGYQATRCQTNASSA